MFKKIKAMNEKQQQLTFEKGITNVPSDVLCSDNTLEESLGMVYDNGEHRVIQDFRLYKTMGSGETLLFVHRFGNKNRYIYKDSTLEKIRWKDDNGHSDYLIKDLTKVDALPQITAIGKTLIIGGKTETYYFVGDWTHNSYSSAFTNLPYPDLEFTFGDEVEKDSNWQTEGQIYSNLFNNWNEFDRPAEVPEHPDFQNGAIGAFNSNLNKLYHDKCFALPFTIRYALELYNGDYTYISDPIPMFPSYSENSWGWDFGDNDTHLTTKGRKLKVKNNDPISDDWSDVIKGIAIFISPFVNIYDTTSNENVMRPIAVNTLVTDKIAMDYATWNQNYDYFNVQVSVVDHEQARFHLLNKRTWDSISYDLMNNGTYYKLCSIKIGEYSGASYDLSAKISDYKLENIVTSELLKVDDYYSRTKTYGEFISTYNERLIMAGLHRNFFDGFKQFIRYEEGSSPSYYAAVVYIKTDDGERIVRKDYQSKERQGKYFYYPDPRAYKVRIYGISSPRASRGTRLYELNLSEHQALNGAYYMQESDLITHATPGSSTEDIPNTDTTQEYLSNQLAMSEVNNPFTFYASGYTTVGNGEIKALSTITQALSQGQFGQYPLLIFATDGIWAGSIANTGYISAVHPMSREVICDGTEKALVQTDGAVFFVTAKGLMVVEGNIVKCVSEQLSGKATTSFAEVLKTAMIAYDYRDSLLWICPNNTNWCYIYSMKSGTFGKKQYLATVTNIVNFYPDSLIQIGTKVYSLTSRPNINEDKENSVFKTYSATLTTRPMKLEDGLALKTIMQMQHIKQMTGSLTLRIFASNNLDNWVELHSLRGTPWKYYKFQYNFSNLIATDRFAGTVLVTQERRTNKLR